jgi:hypothetical protein
MLIRSTWQSHPLDYIKRVRLLRLLPFGKDSLAMTVFLSTDSLFYFEAAYFFFSSLFAPIFPKALKNSMGIGKRMVLAFSLAISVSVAR